MGNVIMKAQQITYGASNVEKALDDLNVPELIELNKRMDAVDAWKANVHEETFTGSELTIENALALPARSLVTSINAIQDLHGYDKPWAGGAYKNKLPMTVSAIKAANTSGTWSGNVYTINGGTITILTDSDGNVTGFKVNGTFNAQMNFYLLANYGTLSDMFGSGNFVLSQGVAFNFADPTGILLQRQEVGANIFVRIGATEVAFTSPDENHYRPIIRFQPGNTLDNAIIQPMVRVSTESATFAPYSNICPISGRTAVVITRSDGDEISEDFTIQLGTTVYGADINWDTGVMTVNKKYLYVDGSDTSILSTINVQLQIAIDSDSYTTESSTDTEFLICNRFNKINNASTESYGIYYRANGSHNLLVKNGYTENQPLSAWVDFLTTNPLQIVYTLATPTTIQLTPTMLEMLKGYNRITVASGYATIELKALVLGGDN